MREAFDMVQSYQVLMAALNFALCTGIFSACVCRFAKMSAVTTRTRFRVAYLLLFLAATISGFSWVFGEWPGLSQIALAIAWLALLGVNAATWPKDGPPDYARKPGVPA